MARCFFGFAIIPGRFYIGFIHTMDGAIRIGDSTRNGNPARKRRGPARSAQENRRIVYGFLKKILFPLGGERSRSIKSWDISQEIMESRFGMADATHPCRKEHGALDGKGGERVDGRMVDLAASGGTVPVPHVPRRGLLRRAWRP
jgi:hypothetical protein